MLRSVLLASVVLASAMTSGVSPATATSQRTATPHLLPRSRQMVPTGCRHPQPVNEAPTVLSASIVRLGQGVVALVSVCIEGAGPFPFLIDTGSALSVIDAHLSRRFHLRQVSAPERAAGIACSTTVVPEQVSNWSIGGATLKPQVLLSAAVPNLSASQPLDGVIGSDVLSRFGSVRIDYRARTVGLGETESASPSGTGVRQGPTAAPTPVQFDKAVRVDAPLTVVSRPGGVGVYAPIRFDGSAARLFTVDTGAEVSMVSSLLARSLHLGATNQTVSLPTAFGCPVKLAEVQSSRWTLGSASLAPQLIARLPVTGLDAQGLLGSDVLSRYGVVVIDYRGARLLLESG